MEQSVSTSAAPARRVGGGWILPLVLLVAALVAVGWSYLQARASAQARERAENALQLQVLASRLGVAAFEAEYGDFEAALAAASEAFEGIGNYGIEHGVLPQDYAEALRRRDDVIARLARGEVGAAEDLMTLFFGLQVPVDVDLDPDRIIPAADSGLGLEPPRRGEPAQPLEQPAATVDSARPGAAGAVPPRPARPDTVGSAGAPASRGTPRDTVRRDTLSGFRAGRG